MANLNANLNANAAGEICTKIDEETKYRIELGFYFSNRPNCWTESDRLSASSGMLTIKNISPKLKT